MRTFDIPLPYRFKRHGISLSSCDDEQVQTPGCAQGQGLLLAIGGNDFIVELKHRTAAGASAGDPMLKVTPQ